MSAHKDSQFEEKQAVECKPPARLFRFVFVGWEVQGSVAPRKVGQLEAVSYTPRQILCGR
jgi:hypothetical protein